MAGNSMTDHRINLLQLARDLQREGLTPPAILSQLVEFCLQMDLAVTVTDLAQLAELAFCPPGTAAKVCGALTASNG